jgi:two-component system response regulator
MKEKIVLLVEDNQDDELLTLRAFRKNNIANQVVVARDGVEALDYLFARGEHSKNPPPLPEFVLLDLNLPRISGLEVLKCLREHPRTKSLPVVVLTSSNEEQDLVHSYEYGANSYIRKPVDFDKFIDAVRQLGMYWLVFNQTVKSNSYEKD